MRKRGLQGGGVLLSEDYGNVEPRGREGEISVLTEAAQRQRAVAEQGGRRECVGVGGGGGVGGVCGGRQFSVNGDDTQQVPILTCRPQLPDRHPAAVNTTSASGGRHAGPSGLNVK